MGKLLVARDSVVDYNLVHSDDAADDGGVDEKPVRVCVRSAGLLVVVVAVAAAVVAIGLPVAALVRVAVVVASADSVVKPHVCVCLRVVAAAAVASPPPPKMTMWCSQHGGVAPGVVGPVATGKSGSDARGQRSRASLRDGGCCSIVKRPVSRYDWNYC